MHNFYNKNKGFTLIELLVVIAIIGLLASIVIVNVNSARTKAKDATVKGNMDHIRITAEMYFDGTGAQAYTNFCGTNGANICTTGDASWQNVCAAIKAQNGNTNPLCYSAATTYCVSSVTVGSGTICRDSQGKLGVTACASAVGCP
jgi:prepilin-type N-terminal cleavage/methylation domain-containing protein